MAIKISMPKLSDTMTEGKLIKWHKKEGDEIKPGDLLAEVETDKANMDLEAFDKGTLLKCMVRESEKVRVGAVLAVLGDKKENIDTLLKEIRDAATPPMEKPAAPTPAPAEKTPEAPRPAAMPRAISSDAPTASPRSASLSIIGGDIRVSPVAAKMAAGHGIPIEGIRGSGPGGRIVKSDVEAIIQQGLNMPTRRQAAPAIQISNKLAETLVPLDGMRKVIAERMTQAKQTIPHFYLQDGIPMDRVVGMRAALNARDLAIRFSYNDFVMMAVSRALMMNPSVNATFDGIGVHTHAHVDLAFAVALENGLITPVVKNCEKLSLLEIHRASEEMAERARKMKLKPDEYLGGTFTISNLGMYGLENFAAVINPPQAAILAVAAVRREACVDDDGHLYVGWQMGVTLACDHRVLDGAGGAQFLRDLKTILDHPESWAA